jgi:hypothetical protein
MDRLATLLAVALPEAQAHDVFSIEYPNRWDAEAARRAAASVSDERPSIGRRALARGLAAVSRGSAAAARRLDDGATDARRTSTAAAH